MSINKGSIGLIALVVGALGAIATASFVEADDVNLIVIEIFKFFLFTCAVGGAALIYTEIEKQRTKADEFQRSRLRFRSEVWEASHKVALSRRMMKVVSRESSEGVCVAELEGWQAHVASLNDAQLSIERLRRVLEANPPELSENEPQLSSDLAAIDKYLRSVLLEIENCDFVSNEVLAISGSRTLNEFLFSKSPPTYVEAFSRLNGRLLGD